MFAQHRAVVRVHLAQEHVVAPQAGEVPQHLPRFALYNPLNRWGAGREVPAAPRETFHGWYARNRGQAKSGGRPS